MIFISYRKDDSHETVSHLRRLLVDRYGAERVYVDAFANSPGARWQDVLRQRLDESLILFAVIGPGWASARYPMDHADRRQRGNLRLRDPEDYVRREICAGVRKAREEGMPFRLVSLLVNGVEELPDVEWECELDELPELQHRTLGIQRRFEDDVLALCGELEEELPHLARSAHRGASTDSPQGIAEISTEALVQRYLSLESRQRERIQLPLVSPDGRPVVAPLEALRIDLPLVVSHEHAPAEGAELLRWLGIDPLQIHDYFRSTHADALLVDRAARHQDLPRDCAISERLAPGSRVVVVGDPGCGKSTLLQWLCYAYALRGSDGSPTVVDGLPDQDWLPVLVLLREHAGRPVPKDVEALLEAHLRTRQYGSGAIEALVPELRRRLDGGRALLLFDGLDEIPEAKERLRFARLLDAIASRFPDAPVVVSSRVVGFQAVREVMASRFDHLLVAPLDLQAKGRFLRQWSRMIGWGETQAEALVAEVCHARSVAKLTDNILMLALVTQIRALDDRLPVRRLDVYRRSVQLLIQRQRPFPGPDLTINEVIPHLEYLAYKMRRAGLQRWSEVEIVAAFERLREQEPDEHALRTRGPEELLEAVIESANLLEVAGTEVDERGLDRRSIQFFHQSFQEYFAGQALNHGRHDLSGDEGVSGLKGFLLQVELQERSVEIAGLYTVDEPVIADYWQESVRLAIADLEPTQAEETIRLLLPTATTEPREGRARAVFALQCLAEEPEVGQPVLQKGVAAAIDHLIWEDGLNTQHNTRMDEAFATLGGSPWRQPVLDQLAEAYLERRGEERVNVGRCFVMTAGAEPVEEAEGSVAAVAARLSAEHPGATRAATALRLMDRCYRARGRLGHLSKETQQGLVDSLLAQLTAEEAIAEACLWAVLWLTGAKWRTVERKLEEFVLLSTAQVERIEAALRRPDLGDWAQTCGCLSLRCEKGLAPVPEQVDWIFEAATVADGHKPSRLYSQAEPTGGERHGSWMLERLDRLGPRARQNVARAAGALGIWAPEMEEPLCDLFGDEKFHSEERDEAWLYLALRGGDLAREAFVRAADTPDTSDTGEKTTDYPYTRGLFGILVQDDVDLTRSQLVKALPHSDLDAYAYGLAGSRDPRGSEMLRELEEHPEPRVRAAVATALAKQAEWVDG